MTNAVNWVCQQKAKRISPFPLSPHFLASRFPASHRLRQSDCQLWSISKSVRCVDGIAVPLFVNIYIKSDVQKRVHWWGIIFQNITGMPFDWALNHIRKINWTFAVGNCQFRIKESWEESHFRYNLTPGSQWISRSADISYLVNQRSIEGITQVEISRTGHTPFYGKINSYEN